MYERVGWCDLTCVCVVLRVGLDSRIGLIENGIRRFLSGEGLCNLSAVWTQSMPCSSEC